MKLTNRTRFEAGFEQAAFKDDRDGVVIVVKATYQIPAENNGTVKLAVEQVPLVSEDTFSDYAPSECADLIYESDFGSFKPRCDIVLMGSAHAPASEPVEELAVMVRVGQWQKRIRVVGHRQWTKNTLGFWQLSSPKPFTQMPLDYQHAFGGNQEVAKERELFEENPAGKGFVYDKSYITSGTLAAPNLFSMDPQENYKSLGQICRPISFAPLSSLVPPRLGLAGTFDDAYVQERFPALPNDFDYGFIQIAPQDQQVPYLAGGESVELYQLMSQGYKTFVLPKMTPAVWVYREGEKTDMPMLPNLDTLFIEPDKQRFQMTWRVRIPFKKNIHEIEEVIIGKQSRAWQRARQKNKSYYASLADLPKKRSQL